MVHQTSMLQLSHLPYLLKVANHSPFAPVPQSVPFVVAQIGGPSGKF